MLASYEKHVQRELVCLAQFLFLSQAFNFEQCSGQLLVIVSRGYVMEKKVAQGWCAEIKCWGGGARLMIDRIAILLSLKASKFKLEHDL